MIASGTADSNGGTSLFGISTARMPALRAPLDVARDRLAGLIKGELEAAAFWNEPVHHAGSRSPRAAG